MAGRENCAWARTTFEPSAWFNASEKEGYTVLAKVERS